MSTAWWSARPTWCCRKTAWCCRLFPQDFVVDDHPGHRDPRKMLASRLEINVHLVTASVQEHNALVGAVNQAHLMVEETVFEGAGGLLSRRCCRRTGGRASRWWISARNPPSWWCIYGDAMYLASTVKVCGDHFTRDLAQALCVSFEDAELVKLEYGGALSEDCPENIWVELPTPESRERAGAAALPEPDFWKRAPPSCSSWCAPNWRGWAWTAALMGGVFLTGGGASCPICATSPSASCNARRALGCRSAFWTGRKTWTISLIGQSDQVDDQPARLLAVHAVHAGDRLHQVVPGQRLVQVHRVRAGQSKPVSHMSTTIASRKSSSGSLKRSVSCFRAPCRVRASPWLRIIRPAGHDDFHRPVARLPGVPLRAELADLFVLPSGDVAAHRHDHRLTFHRGAALFPVLDDELRHSLHPLGRADSSSSGMRIFSGVSSPSSAARRLPAIFASAAGPPASSIVSFDDPRLVVDRHRRAVGHRLANVVHVGVFAEDVTRDLVARCSTACR